ncbi:hypothetical protein ACLOJK_002716 [Asimina triloba]
MIVVYVVVRMLIFHSSVTWKHWVGLIVTSMAYAIPYQQLATMANPTYADDGELLDGGFDMSTGGVCGYILSPQNLAVYCDYPFASTAGFLHLGMVEDEKTRKKRERMEKKASRPKFVKTRTSVIYMGTDPVSLG